MGILGLTNNDVGGTEEDTALTLNESLRIILSSCLGGCDL